MLRILLMSLLLSILATSDCCAVEQHRYLRSTGSERVSFDWRLEPGQDLTLVTDLGMERDVTRMSADLATLSWTVSDPSKQTDLVVSRDHEILRIKGLFKGKQVRRTIRIDSAPWYQALSLSLRQFADPGRQHLEFWSIRPDTLEAHRLQVSRAANEILDVAGVQTETIKLKISLTGLKSVFWSCYYWLRRSDGLFVRYEGPSGPPGWPLTTVELTAKPGRAKAREQELRVQ